MTRAMILLALGLWSCAEDTDDAGSLDAAAKHQGEAPDARARDGAASGDGPLERDGAPRDAARDGGPRPDASPLRDVGVRPDRGVIRDRGVEPDGDEAPPVDQGVDEGVDGAVRDCDELDPFADQSPREVCREIDIFAADERCDAERAGVVCEQGAICDNGFPDRGAVVACCDGTTWTIIHEDPDPCGLPDPED